MAALKKISVAKDLLTGDLERAYAEFMRVSISDAPARAVAARRDLARLYKRLIGSLAGQSMPLAYAVLAAADELLCEAKEIEARHVGGAA
ncbi:hypothetical protein [Saccharopolyspora sp. ASAGF58]|uniref:hypothetical protein n=1 Tax=Saccharopolyspora sp. ASAGF58 TaxID=2719023 RepID=UPI00143FD9D0|nr:hypothetical protein [Saccharopolyspora sp. ASAGF58]QIZ36128.1 hypothetical protein FDZ84_17395 [Saccharopolyspora sp. ASAGF58]